MTTEHPIETAKNTHVTFWQCIIPEHADRRDTVTVEWTDDGVAHCTATGCPINSTHTAGYLDTARAILDDERAKATAENARAVELALRDAAAALLDPDRTLPDVPVRYLGDLYHWLTARAGDLPPDPGTDDGERDEAWSSLEWWLWGAGMGDTFREPLADRMLAAITPGERAAMNRLIEHYREARQMTTTPIAIFRTEHVALVAAVRGLLAAAGSLSSYWQDTLTAALPASRPDGTQADPRHDAWVQGFLACHQSDRGGSLPAQHPLETPAHLADDLRIWSPYDGATAGEWGELIEPTPWPADGGAAQ